MASKDAQEYSLAAIRQLLLAAFTPKELRRFCQEHPTFQPVLNRFGYPYRLDDMVDEMITYCNTNLFFPELLTELKQAKSGQYARLFEPEQARAELAPPVPEILTISHPLSLLLVRVPAGEFLMGSAAARDKYAHEDELPPHCVHVPEFHIGQCPVTNRQYEAFVRATGHEAPVHWEEVPRRQDNHPVVSAPWHDAVAFCDWLSRETGQPFRLPTEAEWEKAARGPDGRIYPWGDEPPDEHRCNFGNNVGGTTTIGRYSPQGDSPYGCADMAGNVWEWCQSLYRPYPYKADDGREDLGAEDPRVVRSGSAWTPAESVRCAYRSGHGPDFWSPHFGFRVARGPLP